MGELADDILEGRSCSICGQHFTGIHGYPVVCKDCWKELDEEDEDIYVRASLNTL